MKLESDLLLDVTKRFVCNFADCHQAFKFHFIIFIFYIIFHYTCQHGDCLKRFRYPAGFHDHMQTKHSETINKGYVCDLDCCGKRYLTSRALLHHGRICSGVKLFVWNVSGCRKPFVYKAVFETHIRRLHTGEKPFECTYDEMRFMSSSEQIRNHRNPTVKRPFQCGDCEKRFKSSGGRRIQERIHSGLKPYACLKCSKCFSQSDNRKRHGGICEKWTV